METWDEKAQRVGRELLELGEEAFLDGDLHEARHLLAAMEVGNTTDCDENCPLHHGMPVVSLTTREA